MGRALSSLGRRGVGERAARRRAGDRRRAPPGAAIDVATGDGRTALWLAARGWNVTGVDFSAEALAIAAARPGGDAVTWVRADVHAWGAAASVDLVCRATCTSTTAPPRSRASPDGWAWAARSWSWARCREHRGRGHGPSDPAILYTPELLRGALDDRFRIERCERLTRGGTADPSCAGATRTRESTRCCTRCGCAEPRRAQSTMSPASRSSRTPTGAHRGRARTSAPASGRRRRPSRPRCRESAPGTSGTHRGAEPAAPAVCRPRALVEHEPGGGEARVRPPGRDLPEPQGHPDAAVGRIVPVEHRRGEHRQSLIGALGVGEHVVLQAEPELLGLVEAGRLGAALCRRTSRRGIPGIVGTPTPDRDADEVAAVEIVAAVDLGTRLRDSGARGSSRHSPERGGRGGSLVDDHSRHAAKRRSGSSSTENRG